MEAVGGAVLVHIISHAQGGRSPQGKTFTDGPRLLKASWSLTEYRRGFICCMEVNADLGQFGVVNRADIRAERKHLPYINTSQSQCLCQTLYIHNKTQ